MNRGNFNQQGGGGNGGSVPPPGFGNYLQSTGNQFGYSNFQQLIRMPSPANDTANVPHILPVFPTSYTPAPIVAPNFSNHPFNQNQRLPINGPMHGHFIQVPEIPATGHFNRYQSQGQQLPVGNQPQPEVTRSEPGVWVHPVVDATVSYGSGFQVEPHASEIGFSAENAPRMERSTRSIPPGFGYTVDGRTLPFAIPRTLAAPIPVRQSSGRNQTRAPSSSAGSSAHCQRVSDSEEEDEESQLGASGSSRTTSSEDAELEAALSRLRLSRYITREQAAARLRALGSVERVQREIDAFAALIDVRHTSNMFLSSMAAQQGSDSHTTARGDVGTARRNRDRDEKTGEE